MIPFHTAATLIRILRKRSRAGVLLGLLWPCVLLSNAQVVHTWLKVPAWTKIAELQAETVRVLSDSAAGLTTLEATAAFVISGNEDLWVYVDVPDDILLESDLQDQIPLEVTLGSTLHKDREHENGAPASRDHAFFRLTDDQSQDPYGNKWAPAFRKVLFLSMKSLPFKGHFILPVKGIHLYFEYN
ncbi:MAG TPA: hypothetical protein PKG48_07615 [Bacteroidales bacterium]|nr:hypothetical protein [Bacteroidales bacterium]HPS62115.1 hypothetical protein [Bacteroidales bacterium]